MDVIIAGHTHAGVLDEVNGITIVEAFAYNRARFSRVDLAFVDPAHDAAGPEAAVDRPRSRPARTTSPTLRSSTSSRPAIEAARARKEEKLGVKILTKITKVYDLEWPARETSSADLMRTARKTDVAITNGGGLRTDLDAGDLTYGALYEAYPFDNRMALMHMTGERLANWIGVNLQHGKGIFSVSGVRVKATCKDGSCAWSSSATAASGSATAQRC